MSYNSLPNEIVLRITDFIRSADVESFAQADKRTFDIARNRLEEQRAYKRNAKVMASRFPQSDDFFMRSTLSLYDAQKLCPDLDRLTSEARAKILRKNEGGGHEELMTDLEYLALNGDLHWLQPEMTVNEHRWPRGEAASTEKLEELVASAERVGVKFPDAFLKIMGSKELINSIFLGGNYFTLGPSLVKCNAGDDNDGGGYVIRFLSDQQACWEWALYLAPGGHHCILRTAPSDLEGGVHCFGCEETDPWGGENEGPIDGHPRFEAFKGVPRACEDLVCEFLWADFEEILAFTHFDGWSGWRLLKEKELTDSQKEYIANLK